MESLISFLPLLAPMALITVFVAAHRSRIDPEGVMRLGGMATGLGLGLSLLTLAAVLAWGGNTSPLLGIEGIGLSLRLDLLSATMFGVVSFVGFIVVRYSRGYLEGDDRQRDFIGRLCLALAAVTLLVLAGNLAQLVVAWVAASLALHRLLVFYADRPRAVAAGRKKMIAARAGDVCLLIAAVLLAKAFGSSDIATIAERAAALAETPPGATAAMWLLMAAAVLKSAQFPFHAWLPEVMETPTPVSALLHAGMINSGGFLVLRFADVMVLAPTVMTALLAIGAVTAVFGSMVMLTQSTIKGSLAHSTLAQMGLMMVECGLGAFSVAILHIVAHSMYKAHAFLSAGGAVLDRPLPAPRPIGRFSAAAVVGAAALAAVWASALFVDPSEAIFSATAALASVVAFGIVIWSGRQLEGRHWASATTALSIAALTPVVFLALKSGADLLFGPVLPSAVAPTSSANGILALTIGAMGVLAWLQLAGFPTGPLGRRLYVFVRSGGYVEALSDRWSGAIRIRAGASHPDFGSAQPVASAYASGPSLLGEVPKTPSAEEIDAARERAVRAIPPLWPLSDFVAVNPFLGLTDRTFEEASVWLERSSGARTTMPRSFYAEAIDAGDITRADLTAALSEGQGAGLGLGDLERGARMRDRALVAAPTVADVALRVLDVDVPRLVVERIASWAGTHFDRGQAGWASPWRHEFPYRAWRGQAVLDRAPELLGLADLRAFAADLPESPAETISVCVEQLGLSAESLELYFQRLLMRLPGWAGHLRYAGWSAELAGHAPSELDDLLAIALAWECALLEADPRIASAWNIARFELESAPAHDPGREIDLALHRAFEIASQRQLAERLTGAVEPAADDEESEAQLVFCIDVRSERLRRSLEACAPRVQTLGFAGFFGMAIEWIPLGESTGVASCPVLLEPGHSVREASDHEEKQIARRRFQRVTARAWSAFKTAAVSSFAFVETLGILYAVKLIVDSTKRPRPAGREESGAAVVRPSLELERLAGRVTGISQKERLDLAEGALRAMSLTHDFAPLVVLTAHGSSTVNNPYAAGLDCGACGGRSGEPNARVAAAILNDPDVRSGLATRGIRVPDSTVFLGALHDTTTDVVTLCDREAIPATHRARVERLEASLGRAGRLARLERAPSLGCEESGEQGVFGRSVDWSQIRPEWGLAGCTAFIAAPRRFTSDARLDTSAFLHEYRWTEDKGFGVLETIMTAPMVVASWINLQYFASTVDNRAFGAGNKTLHNVVGGLGALEGNGGDLRVGLPIQSVHSGSGFYHRPARLTVAIAAPIEAMTDVIERHDVLKDLLNHGWISLVALDDSGRIAHRYVGDSTWDEVPNDAADEVAA